MASLAHDYASVDAFDGETRQAATRTPYSPLMLLLTVLSTLGVLYYGWFLWRPENRGDMLPWLLVIVAESILVLHGLAVSTTLEYEADPTFEIEATGSSSPSLPRLGF